MTYLAKSYTAWWIAWALFVGGTEFFFPGWRAWSLPVGLLWFVLVEGAAVIRRGGGDTLSEHVWAAYAGKKGRLPFVLGVVAYFAIALWEMGTNVMLRIGPIEASRFVLALGICGWLVPHFITRGRDG